MKIKIICNRLPFLLIFLFSVALQAQISTISGAELSEYEIDIFLERQMEKLQMSGLSIAVIHDNKVAYHKNFGVKNTDTKELVTSQTVFEAASLTKPLFAYYTMRMVEKGVIDLDTPLCEYLANPELDFDVRYRTMTARHVLSHSTGLPNWRYLIDKLSHLKFQFSPGEQFAYSGEAYEYLANVIAHLNGGTLRDLEDMINREVLSPLQMTSSCFAWNQPLEQHKAYGHALPNLPNDRYKPIVARVSGGLHSNAKDYSEFIIALMTGQGLAQSSIDLLLQPAIELPEENAIRRNFGVENWTLGFGHEDTEYGEKISHGGNNGDFQSYFEFYPNQGIGYVFMSNSSKGIELNNQLKDYLTYGNTDSQSDQFNVVNRRFTEVNNANHNGITLTAGDQSGFAWIKGENFSEGRISFDVRGENLRGQSFVGFAFHADDEMNYDCLYLRPYLFQSSDPTEQNYMLQYISMPENDWFNLRSTHPNIYEAKIENAPKETDWVNMQIEVSQGNISVYINRETSPSMQFKYLNNRHSGDLGFWVGNASKGDFANIEINHY